MKKRAAVFFIALLSVSLSFAKEKFEKLERKNVYVIYKIEIRKDIDRAFYARTLGYPECSEEPHTSGYQNVKKEKALFKDFDFDEQYRAGISIGQMTYTQCEYDDKGRFDLNGLFLNLFGLKYDVLLPVSNNYNIKNKTIYNTIVYDPNAKYVYLGTFVYDFVDGMIYPKLVEVKDEYDEAKMWAEEIEGKEIQLARATIE